MLNRRILTGASTAMALALVSLSTYGQSLNQNLTSYLADLTPWGDPNLQGVWDRRTITPLERPERFEGKAFITPDEI